MTGGGRGGGEEAQGAEGHRKDGPLRAGGGGGLSGIAGAGSAGWLTADLIFLAQAQLQFIKKKSARFGKSTFVEDVANVCNGHGGPFA